MWTCGHHRSPVSIFLTVLCLVAAAHRPAAAQARVCGDAEPPSIGAAVGRSSPNLDLVRGAVEWAPSESILVRSGPDLAIRGEAPIAGPMVVRVEASFASWDVERQTYTADLRAVAARSSAGRVTVRHLGAAVGWRGGRSPVCWHVLAGGGVYGLALADWTTHRPGGSITAGIGVPAGPHGRVDVDVRLHLIQFGTGAHGPVGDSTVLAASLTAGWSYVF